MTKRIRRDNVKKNEVKTEKTYIEGVRINFLYVDKYSFGGEWYMPESKIPYSMLRYITAGKAIFIIDGKEITVEKNQVVYIPRGCELSCYALGSTFSFMSIRFNTSVYYDGGDFLKDYYEMPDVLEDRGEKEYFEKIYDAIHLEGAERMFLVRGYLELLIGKIIERVGKDNAHLKREVWRKENSLNSGTERMDERIRSVVDFMVLHPTETYTTARLCEMAGLGETRFRKLFKEQTGKSPGEYLRDMRMTVAGRRLLLSAESVSDIAYSVGYEDVNFFIRVFKKYFGVTPNQYRKVSKE